MHINPYVDQWEKEGNFPAHKIFKTLGDAGFLGINKPVGKLITIEFLHWSYPSLSFFKWNYIFLKKR